MAKCIHSSPFASSVIEGQRASLSTRKQCGQHRRTSSGAWIAHPSNRSSQEASRTRLTMRCPSVMSRLSCASDTSQRPSGSMTWAKYSKPMNATPQLTDPNTKQPPTTNLFYSVDYGTALPNFGSTIQELVKTESISRSAKWRHAGWLAASRRTRVWMPTPSIRSLSRTRSRTAISCPQECWL